MPWKETCPVEQRQEFVEEFLKDEESMAELCRQFGVSRQTGYKYLRRYRRQGLAGLAQQSRAPRHHPNQVRPEVEDAIILARLYYPRWGPRKLRAYLDREIEPGVWPAASTIGEILSDHKLALPRKRRRHATPSSQPLSHCTGPNRVWCADYKGHFRTGDGCRCDPLTITDGFSRYLLCCQRVARADHDHTRGWFERVFREYGLPAVIRTDNGAPFGSTGLCGLTRLSVWWIRLGIRPERIEPGHPEQNGRHERMHLTLKGQTAQPPAATLRAQQRRFNQFRREYNRERPHEALGMATPASRYESSPRAYPARLPELEYPGSMTVRQVHVHGQIDWRGQDVFLGEALRHERVGLEAVAERSWRVWLGALLLGRLEGTSRRLAPEQAESPADEGSPVDPATPAGRASPAAEAVPERPRPSGFPPAAKNKWTAAHCVSDVPG
jgi:putative transposase